MKKIFLLSAFAILIGAFSVATAMAAASTGTIAGTLGYPSEGIPKGMKVCAERMLNFGDHVYRRKFCTRALGENADSYALKLPAGDYIVYQELKEENGQFSRSYYTEYSAACFAAKNCPSHNLILVHVEKGKTYNGINPFDWYLGSSNNIKSSL